MTTKTKIDIQRYIIIFHGLLWFVLLPFRSRLPYPNLSLSMYSLLIFLSGCIIYGAFSLVTGFNLWFYSPNPEYIIVKTGATARCIGAFYFLFGIIGWIIMVSSRFL